jgi:hypothetical protein
MFDGKNDTCWNSDQGSPQFVLVEFPKAVKVEEIRLRFQGGFVGKDCSLYAGSNPQELIHQFYPEDSNSLQVHIHASCDCHMTSSCSRLLFQLMPRTRFTNSFLIPAATFMEE